MYIYVCITRIYIYIYIYAYTAYTFDAADGNMQHATLC